MRRLVWAGVGAAAAVLVTRRLRQTARRYTPAAVQDHVHAARERTGSALQAALTRFGEARAERERDLTAALLVQPEGGDAKAVLGRRRDRAGHAGAADVDPAPDDVGPAPAVAARSRPRGRVDEDEPLYDF